MTNVDGTNAHHSHSPAVATPGRKRLRLWLILESVLAIPGVVLGGFGALMSPMMFDAPGSTENVQVLVMFWSVLTFPVVLVIAMLAAWIAYVRHHERAALVLSLLPILPLVGFAISLVL